MKYFLLLVISFLSCSDENPPPQFWRGCMMERCEFDPEGQEKLCKYSCQIRWHWLKKENNTWVEL